MTQPTETTSANWSDDPEVNDFCNELLGAVREMKAGQAARITKIPATSANSTENKSSRRIDGTPSCPGRPQAS